MRRLSALLLAFALLIGPQSLAAQPRLDAGTVADAAARLSAGEFLWAPEVAPEGPVMLVVSLANQRAVLYRNGLPIAITTVSTGRAGHRTPTGIFTVLQRAAIHYSSIYNNAPMPHMQRLTSYGVALHGGDLPGYPASHGCIRLPREFARLLFGVTRLGMTVVITNEAAVPRLAPAETLMHGGRPPLASDAAVVWQPERSRTGPVSIVISGADRRLVVLRNGVIIGTAPITLDGRISGTTAYVMRAQAQSGRSWLRIELPGQMAAAAEDDLRGRIQVPEQFRRDVDAILQPGTTVVITGDTLRSSGSGDRMTVLEGETGR